MYFLKKKSIVIFLMVFCVFTVTVGMKKKEKLLVNKELSLEREKTLKNFRALLKCNNDFCVGQLLPFFTTRVLWVFRQTCQDINKWVDEYMSLFHSNNRFFKMSVEYGRFLSKTESAKDIFRSELKQLEEIGAITSMGFEYKGLGVEAHCLGLYVEIQVFVPQDAGEKEDKTIIELQKKLKIKRVITKDVYKGKVVELEGYIPWPVGLLVTRVINHQNLLVECSLSSDDIGDRSVVFFEKLTFPVELHFPFRCFCHRKVERRKKFRRKINFCQDCWDNHSYVFRRLCYADGAEKKIRALNFSETNNFSEDLIALDDCFSGLHFLYNIVRLSFAFAKLSLSGKVLRFFANQKNLQDRVVDLDLACAKVKNNCNDVRGFRNLKRLILRGNSTQNTALSKITGDRNISQSLEVLDLSSCRGLTDFSCLKHLDNIKVLILDETKVDADMLKDVAANKKIQESLKYIDIYDLFYLDQSEFIEKLFPNAKVNY